MEIEIIAKEMIKPSSPTPNHLRNYKLCLLDQLIPAAYAPIVLFYPNQDAAATHLQVLERIALLKKSISEVLSRFYPLAGAIKDDVSVDCDDRGACFTTAKVKHALCEFLENPDLKAIASFLSCDESYVTNIQASLFECGGIAIGLCISHRILDGTALSTFLKAWSDIAAASSSEERPMKNINIYPDFSASSLFPSNDSRLKQASMAMWGCLFKKGQFVTKRFVFDRLAITALKEMATGGDGKCAATSVEAVSGFIWKHAMAASEESRFGTKKPSLLTHVVNLRKRASPNLSENSLGNLIWMASAKLHSLSDNDDHHRNLGLISCLVDRVRKSISKIDGDYVKKIQGDDGFITMHKYLKEIEELGSKDVDYYGFTSWRKLGFYEVDFGWGKPVWVSSIDSSGYFFMNLVILMDTRCGSGIEAWMTLDKQEMDALERNKEFRARCSVNPSPLSIGKDQHKN
ncbi:limonoid 7-O-acetyltransferse-like [Henckelia pumila]|uniref:limonoid 7-O-acetyltransferse-like n=1 Tax=Henckelia pumila TaxID=405737 RepID=UPI003C6E577E